jgi:uncharacterized circularly permuted ATP-grasp superfamily protein
MYTQLPYEFFTKGAQKRDHYKNYDAWLARQPGDMMAKRREEAEMIFRRVGITYAVYCEKDEEGAGTERLIPFDLIPRIIPASEWSTMEKGLVQRVSALNRFIHDVYRKVYHDVITPERVAELLILRADMPRSLHA